MIQHIKNEMTMEITIKERRMKESCACKLIKSCRVAPVL